MQATTGWFLLSVVASGAIGIFLHLQKIEIGLGCTNSIEAFDLLGWSCRNALPDSVFNIGLGGPRLAIIFPSRKIISKMTGNSVLLYRGFI